VTFGILFKRLPQASLTNEKPFEQQANRMYQGADLTNGNPDLAQRGTVRTAEPAISNTA
jgi:hypothetical protein